MKQKIKIMKHKPGLSDEEIRGYMDFERLMERRKLATRSGKLYRVITRTVPLVAITGIAAWFIFFSNRTSLQSVTKDGENKKNHPVQKMDEQVPTTTKPEQSTANNVKTDKSDVKLSTKKERKEAEVLALKDNASEDVYVQAEPLDGYASLYDYFNTNLVYPSESVKDSTQGVQTVSFVINSEGKPENILVKQSLGEPFEKEARRLIENMPLWKPATLNNKPVPSQVSLPLTFQIQKVKIKE